MDMNLRRKPRTQIIAELGEAEQRDYPTFIAPEGVSIKVVRVGKKNRVVVKPYEKPGDKA